MITINTNLYLSISLFLLSLILIRKLRKTFITSATSFFFGWTFLLWGTNYAINQKWINEVSLLSNEFIFYFLINAFLGIIIATLIFPVKRDFNKFQLFYEQSSLLLKKVSNKFLLILFILGVLFLFNRLSSVGFSLDYLSEVREVYNQGNRLLIDRIATHISVIVSLFIILIGVKDSKEGVNLKYIGLVIFAAAPLGLANGGRTFLLNYVILYLASLFLARGLYGQNKYILSKKEWIPISVYMFILLLIFALLGFTRGGYGKEFDFLYTILIWPISTMGALDTWLNIAIQANSTNGYFSFGWFSQFSNSIGLVNYTEEINSIKKIFANLFFSRNSAAVIPKSIIPELIFDFGTKGAFIGIFIAMFILQFFSLRFGGKGIFTHTLASLSVVAAFQTIQTSIPTPPIVITLFWAFIFSIIIKLKSKDRIN